MHVSSGKPRVRICSDAQFSLPHAADLAETNVTAKRYERGGLRYHPAHDDMLYGAKFAEVCFGKLN